MLKLADRQHRLGREALFGRIGLSREEYLFHRLGPLHQGHAGISTEILLMLTVIVPLKRNHGLLLLWLILFRDAAVFPLLLGIHHRAGYHYVPGLRLRSL